MTMDQVSGRIGPDEMTKFRVLQMRAPAPKDAGLVINVACGNDRPGKGDFYAWAWASPTNTRYQANFQWGFGATDDECLHAKSVECLWQGTKLFTRSGPNPDQAVLEGDWRKAKGWKPIGAWGGPGRPLLDVMDARRLIYVPAYRHQILQWLVDDPEVEGWVDRARVEPGPVYLRDFDTGQGLDNPRPMSHAWVLSVFLNKGVWPDYGYPK